MTGKIAGIDVHKRVLMVAVEAGNHEGEAAAMGLRRFGTMQMELEHLTAWLQAQGVAEVVMESTAQYWKPVWFALEPHFRLRLAQAWSNRAPRGKKTDFKDAERLVRRHRAGELTLSFVPEEAQRLMRTLARRRFQLTRERVRIQNQVESLLEETRIKLSSVISDLFGGSGMRILEALSEGQCDAQQLAGLADARIQCSVEILREALAAGLGPVHRQLLRQHLAMLHLVDAQIEQTAELMADRTRPHLDAVRRLTAIPGIRALAAQQLIAEIGPTAEAFGSAPQFCSWGGLVHRFIDTVSYSAATAPSRSRLRSEPRASASGFKIRHRTFECVYLAPGRAESAGHNYSSRCPKGNMYLRRVLCQVAQAAVRTNNSFFEQKFRRLLPRLGYAKAIWAIARSIAVVVWKILHDGVEYIERGAPSTPGAIRRRLQRLCKELRALGYSDHLTPLTPEAIAS